MARNAHKGIVRRHRRAATKSRGGSGMKRIERDVKALVRTVTSPLRKLVK